MKPRLKYQEKRGEHKVFGQLSLFENIDAANLTAISLFKFAPAQFAVHEPSDWMCKLVPSGKYLIYPYDNKNPVVLSPISQLKKGLEYMTYSINSQLYEATILGTPA